MEVEILSAKMKNILKNCLTENSLKDYLIVFDWGGVVEQHRDYALESAWGRVFQSLGGSDVSLSSALDGSFIRYVNDISANYNVGATEDMDTVIEWGLEICHHLSDVSLSDVRPYDFLRAYIEAFMAMPYYQDTVNFIHILRDTLPCRFGILSNLCVLDKGRIDAQMDFNYFDYRWLSFAMGCAKPDPKIYELVEKENGCSPEHIIFFDDSSANILAASARGWHAFCVEEGNAFSIYEGLQMVAQVTGDAAFCDIPRVPGRDKIMKEAEHL